jgi:adenosylcobinamide-phosphate synthase
MSFLALLFAFLIEQVRPVAHDNWAHRALRAWLEWISHTFDAGQEKLAWMTWALAVGVPSVLSLIIHWSLLAWLGWHAAMIWSVGVLYLALGFRQFSHYFTDIRDALEEGDEPAARESLAHWKQVEVVTLPRQELLRHVIEFSVLSAHRHVFGVMACFSFFAALGFGPAGAVVYRMSEWVSRIWAYAPHADNKFVSLALQACAKKAWYVVDWLPARMTAVAFGVVGNFEDAIDCWRNYAQRFSDDNDGVVIAATSGALNVQLGGAAMPTGGDDASVVALQEGATYVDKDSESTPGRPPEKSHLASVVGLVWRSVVLWMVLLALLTLARLLG